jgi:hypothetical protein
MHPPDPESGGFLFVTHSSHRAVCSSVWIDSDSELDKYDIR